MKPEKWISISVTSAGDLKRVFETISHIICGLCVWGANCFWQTPAAFIHFSCCRNKFVWAIEEMWGWNSSHWSQLKVKSGKLRFLLRSDQGSRDKVCEQIINYPIHPPVVSLSELNSKVIVPSIAGCKSIETYMRSHPDDILFSRQCSRSGWKVEIFM